MRFVKEGDEIFFYTQNGAMCFFHQAVTLLVRTAVTGIFRNSTEVSRQLCNGIKGTILPEAVERGIKGYGLLTAKPR